MTNDHRPCNIYKEVNNDCNKDVDNRPTMNIFKLIRAVESNDFATVSSFIASDIHPPPLIVAASFGRVEIASQLLDAGVDIDAVNNAQRSACHLAIRGNHFDVLKLLVDRGAQTTRCSRQFRS
jgi:hypothetical protein